MKKAFLIACLLIGIVGSASAQRDDLYFIPKKKKAVVSEKADVESANRTDDQASSLTTQSEGKTLSVTAVPAKKLLMDEDTYNRRGAYLTEEGDAVSEFAMSDKGFVLITEEGDTMRMDTDTLRLTRVEDGEGWVNGFEGSDSDYEYAMRIVRFRNPRYAIPVSSPLYWDVVYGDALWPSWEWNVYDDGMYAYVFPTSNNWHYWDYMMSYPFGWSAYHHGYHWVHHWGSHCGWQFYGHVWYDPWFNPYFHDYYPGWHHGHHHGPHHGPHYGYYPGFGKPGWGGPKAFPNHRTAMGSSTRRGSQSDNTAARGSVSTSRRGTASGDAVTRRGDGGSTRNSAVRVVTGRSGDASRSSGTVRSSQSSRTGRNDEVVRRSTGSSSVNRSATSGGSSRGTYTRQSSSRSSSGSSYNRPSSTRSTSSVSRSSSSSSRSGSYSGSSSSSSRSSSYSSGSRSGSSSSYSSGSSSRSNSSYSSGSSYSGGSRSGGSYSSGSRSGGGSRR